MKTIIKNFLIFILFIFGFIQLLGVVSGVIDGIGHFYDSPYNCDGSYFSKRFHYVVPLQQVTCRSVVWLRERPKLETK